MPRLLVRVGCVLSLLFLLFVTVALAAWEHSFPATVTDTSAATRTYHPALLGYSGTSLINAGYIAASGLDTNMQIGTSSIKYMVADSEVATVIPTLPNSGQVQTNLYTGYTPNQVEFPIIAGGNGYVTIADAAALEPGNNFVFEFNGYVLTSGLINAPLLAKQAAVVVYTTNGRIAAGMGMPSVEAASDVDDATTENASGLAWVGQTFTTGASGLSTARVRVILGNGPVRGLVTLGIRATTAGLPTGSDLASYSVVGSSIPAPGAVDFYLTAYLEAGTVYALVLRYPNGAGAVGWYQDGANPYAGGQKVTSADGGAIWAADAATDMRFVGVYKYPISVIDAKATADYGIKVSADVADFKLEIDSGAGYVLEDSIALGGNTVPNNAATWYLAQNNVMPYIDYYRHTVGGVEIVEYQPATMLTALAVGSAVGYPSIATGSSGTNASTTTHAVTMPSGVGAKNLLIALLAYTGSPAVTWPSGWTLLFTASSAANNTLSAAYKVAVGNETSISVTTATAQTSSYQVLRIGYYQGVPQVGVANTGAGAANPDPPNLAPTWGATNTLWIAVAEDSVNMTGSPVLYQYYVLNGTTPYLHTGYRQLNAAAENPGTFTAGAGNWVANTIAVEIANPSEIVDLDGGDQDGILTWGYNTGLTVVGGAMTTYESTSATGTAGVGFTMPTSPMPSTWFAAGENVAALPFYDSFNNVAGQLGMPVQTIYFWGILGLALGAALFLMVFTRSALLGVMAMIIILFIGSSMTIVPMWIPFSVLVVDIAIMYLYRQVSY